MKSFSIKKKDTFAVKENAFSKRGKDESNPDDEISKDSSVLTESVVTFENTREPERHEPERQELIIKPVANRDWRSEMWKREGLEESSQITEPEPKYGLYVPEKESKDLKVEVSNEESPIKKAVKPLTDDELARFHLLNQRTLEQERVIEMQQAEPRVSETQAYREDITSRPDEPDLEAYNRVPVEEFGAALLRGMGWKGTDAEQVVTEVKQRPFLLGLGAKPLEAAVEESGAWGKGARKNPTRAEKSYVPLIKVNKRTGEVVNDNDNDHSDNTKADTGEKRQLSQDNESHQSREQESYQETLLRRNPSGDKEYESKKRSQDIRKDRERDNYQESHSRHRQREYSDMDRDYENRRRHDKEDRYDVREKHGRDQRTDYDSASRRKDTSDDPRRRYRDSDRRDNELYDQDRRRRYDSYESTRSSKKYKTDRYSDSPRRRERR
jgi:hypothetical protein